MTLGSPSVPSGVRNMFPITPAERSAVDDRSQTVKQVVVFFTHVFDRSIELRYEKLKSDLGELAQIAILAPLGTSIPQQYSDETSFFDYDRLRSGALRVIGDQLVPGNVHLALLDFFRNHPAFEYYWFVEYDVVFTGDWAALFGAVKDDRADLLAAHLRNGAEEPAWPWWKTLDLPGCPLSQSDRIRAFFPVHRISQKGLQTVEKFVKQGWSGHYEGLIPCAIHTASLSISDFGGDSRWTPKDRRFRFYSSFSSDAGGSLNAGTHRHRPPHQFLRLRRNMVFHPVKAGSSNSGGGILQFMKHLYLRELPMRCAVSLSDGFRAFWPLSRKREK